MAALLRMIFSNALAQMKIIMHFDSNYVKVSSQGFNQQ